jgi:hypothetical protein
VLEGMKKERPEEPAHVWGEEESVSVAQEK